MFASLLLTLALPLAPSGTPADHLAQGKAAIDSLDYDRAAEELTIAAVHRDASLAQRIEANLYAGIAHRILGRDVDSKLNFVFVLKHAPDTPLPSGTPPKIQNFYDLIRLELGPTAPIPPVPPAQPDDVVANPNPGVPSKPDSSASDSSAPSSSGSPVSSTSADASEPMIGLLMPSLLIAAGVLALAAGGSTALVLDLFIADPSLDGSAKEGATYGGFSAVAVAGFGAATALLGAGLFVWGALE